MAPETGKLASFEDFVHRMKSQLTLVPQGELESLLECLYEAAKAKIEFEDYRKWAQDMAGSYRKMRKAMEVAGKALTKASHILENAKQDNKELGQIEWIEGDFKFSFDEITQQVNRARKAAEDGQAFLAAMVHPHLRTEAENDLAKKLRDPDLDPRSLEAFVFPARAKSPEIDHWFIGAAAECLDKSRTGIGEALPRYDKIISELFKVAFHNEARDDENIRTELGRQKKSGRPAYHVPGQPIPGTVVGIYTADLEPKTSGGPPQGETTSGQKREK